MSAVRVVHVGMGALKSSFDRYIRWVQKGEVIFVTQGTRVVAEIHPRRARAEPDDLSTPGDSRPARW